MDLHARERRGRILRRLAGLGLLADRERSLRLLRRLPADVWVTAHARWWGRYRKYVASQTASRPADAFIDPQGYRDFIDAAEAELRSGRTH